MYEIKDSVYYRLFIFTAYDNFFAPFQSRGSSGQTQPLDHSDCYACGLPPADNPLLDVCMTLGNGLELHSILIRNVIDSSI